MDARDSPIVSCLEERELTQAERKLALQIGTIVGAVRGLDAIKRCRALFKRRGWPYGGKNGRVLVDVVATAIALTSLGAGGTLIRRPIGAAGCGRAWPEEFSPIEAELVVEWMNVMRLCEPA